MILYNESTSSGSRKIINGGCRASGITDAIKIGLSKLPSLDPFQDIDLTIKSNTEVSVNLSALCCMGLEIEFIANNFKDEEDDDEIWQKDDGDERRAFYFFQNFMDGK